MEQKKHSLLLSISPTISKDSACIEITDPESATSEIKDIQASDSLSSIMYLLDNIKNNLRKNDPRALLYQHWIDRGWRKSLDYYVSSRVNPNADRKLLSHATISCENLCADQHEEIRHGLLQSLLNRRTKRLFNGNLVSSSHYYHCFKKLASHIPKGVNLYTIVYNVSSILPGIYIYLPNSDTFELVREGNYSEEMSQNLQGLAAPKGAAFTLIMSVDFNIFQENNPYQRALRDLYIEVGRLGQKYIVLFGQFDIFSLVTPALSDRATAKLLRLDAKSQAPIYSLTFGYPKKE